MDQYPYVNFVRGSAYNIKENDSIYARYHRQLDDFVEKRKPVVDQQDQIAKKLTPAATPVIMRPVVPAGVRRAVAAIGNSKPGSKNDQILEDFLRRKAEYDRNKARGKQAAVALPSPRPPSVNNNRGNDEKWAYEQRLLRVRQQNYENRRVLASRNKAEVIPNHRLQKAAALRVRF